MLHEGQQALMLEDAGGDPLAPSATGPLPLERFLRVAVGAASALHGVHCQGLIHKDIKPSNLLVDTVGGVRITGFGIASQLPREQQQLVAPATIDGTLAYMAPEQTGRMNRSIDTRSDLYALGVSFYEMLSGVRPFEANEPLEWVHCHVARSPMPLKDRLPGLPDPVNSIVMKLLAKSVEERYQTASGLEKDLLHCLGAVESGQQAVVLSLGQHDIPDHLVIPERLYGRDTEIEALAAAFRRVAETGRSRVMLVSGYSGVGKSVVVNELRPVVARARGLMAGGKFDQYRRDIPYATIGEALQNITQRVLGTPLEERARWRRVILEALGDNGQVMVSLVPELEVLLGKQPQPVELPPLDSELRFHRVVRQFLDVFVQGGYPLTLFIDDLQWLDAASLSLLTALFDDNPPHSLLLVGAYRDNEIDSDHSLWRTVNAVRHAGIEVEELHLNPLRLDDLTMFVADTLHATSVQVAPLAQLIHEKTGGNPLFAGQFMTALADEGLLSFDHPRTAWQWDLDRIRTKGPTDNVADLVMARLVRLAVPTRALLVTLACLGTAATAERLALAHDVSADEVHMLAKDAVSAGLLVQGGGSYRFLHDRIQEGVYDDFPAEQRAQHHLQIGRRLANGLPPAERDDAIFDVVDHYNRGNDLIAAVEERDEVAALNLLAGQRARASTAFASALTYLETGRRLLGAGGWERADRLAFALSFQAAECRFLTGDHQAAESELLSLADRATDIVDRATIASLLITLFTAQDRSDRAVETCLAFLRNMNVAWSAHPAPPEPWAEYRILMDRLAGRPIHSLLDLPLAEDQEPRAVLDVLAAVLPPAFFTDQNLVCLVLCRMANYSLDHGNCNASPLGYAYLGMVAGPYFGSYTAGFEFGRLGRDLVEERGLRRYAARVHMCFAYHVAPWTRHVSFSLPLLRRAFDIAVQAGDLTYCGFTACTTISSVLAAGAPLSEVQREAEAKLEFVRRIKFGLIIDIITSQVRLVGGLRGLTPDFVTLGRDRSDEAAFERHLESEPSLAIAACWHWIRKLQAAVLGSQYEAALAAAAKAEPLLWTTSGHLEMAEYHFHKALAHAGCHKADDGTAHRAALTVHLEQLRIWSEHCPENFGARAAIVAGAVAAIDGDNFAAMGHFEDAIRSARQHHLTHVEAIAHEWAARFYRRHEFVTTAITYLRNARDCYLQWGATAKVQQLEQIHRELLGNPVATAEVTAEHQLSTLDLTSLIRTSQAVSGEVGLRRMIQTLMEVVLEHAGAERGLLFLPRLDGLRLEAEALTESHSIEVRLHQALLSGTHAPASVLHHAMQTQEAVLLDDAQQSNQFSEDAYLASTGARSILCIPLTKQGKLTGLLYLENKLTPFVFTPTRVAVLKLLASQAAISLENAALEEKEALLKEMHHRVKNNLQLISSLLNLQVSRISDPTTAGLFADSRDRVRSMALVHENLYRAGDYARVPMPRHIELLCAQLGRAYRLQDQSVTVTLQVQDLQFDLDRAVSCGLIINELVTNAFKHAFPDGRSGRITVCLDQLDHQNCRLTVHDDGVGFPPNMVPDPDTAPTLGLQLVGDLVHQLHGSIEFDHSTGARFTVIFRTS
jgi:predicted ATPase/two-component sensor histidine kinase